MALLYGRAGRLTIQNGGFWPGQNEWLGAALDATVTAFRARICDEGQAGITMVCEEIEYAFGAQGKPRSVAVKLNQANLDHRAAMSTLYGREIYFFCGFGRPACLSTTLRVY